MHLAAVKGMSVQFQLPEGDIHSLVVITLPIFVTKSPQIFFGNVTDGHIIQKMENRILKN